MRKNSYVMNYKGYSIFNSMPDDGEAIVYTTIGGVLEEHKTVFLARCRIIKHVIQLEAERARKEMNRVLESKAETYLDKFALAMQKARDNEEGKDKPKRTAIKRENQL